MYAYVSMAFGGDALSDECFSSMKNSRQTQIDYLQTNLL